MYHEPYAQWLKRVVPRTRGQLEYLFIINAGIYLLLQSACERLPLAQMRGVAKTFRFVIPGHVLTSLLLLGLAATDLWDKSPQSAGAAPRSSLLRNPVAPGCLPVCFRKHSKQMKNFLATGLLFLAIGIVRLEQDSFQGARCLAPQPALDRPPADVRRRQLLSSEDDPHPVRVSPQELKGN